MASKVARGAVVHGTPRTSTISSGLRMSRIRSSPGWRRIWCNGPQPGRHGLPEKGVRASVRGRDRSGRPPPAVRRDEGLLQVPQGVAVLVDVVPDPLAGGGQPPGRGAVVEGEVQQPAHLVDLGLAGQVYEALDPAVEVAVHEVGRPDPRRRGAAVL